MVVVGSGAAGLVCALFAAVGGLRVVVLEKSDKLGGTSAMSGGAVWVPANHHGRAAGVADSPAQALAYLRATAPKGWRDIEDTLWAPFTAAPGPMLEFVEMHTPLRFSLTPDRMFGSTRRGPSNSAAWCRRIGPVEKTAAE